MSLYQWSQTASSNASADPSINWAEGQPPSSINDSARAMMAATAKYRDDIAGSIVTGGTSVAYTVASSSVFDTLVHLSGQMIAFVPHTTSGAGSPSVTLNVDGLGAKPIRSAPSIDIPSGTLVQGTPYVVTYNNSDGAFYLQNFFGNPYNVPLGASLDYWGAAAPNSSFAFPFGQAISRTTYATLFSVISTIYGGGDGSTTFNLPDVRGRVVACVDNMGGTSANRLLNGSMSGARNTLGGAGGADTHTLTASEIPSITSNANNTITINPGTALAGNDGGVGNVTVNPAAPQNVPANGTTAWRGITSLSTTTNITVSSNNTGGQTHDNLQPMILCQCIMRII